MTVWRLAAAAEATTMVMRSQIFLAVVRVKFGTPLRPVGRRLQNPMHSSGPLETPLLEPGIPTALRRCGHGIVPRRSPTSAKNSEFETLKHFFGWPIPQRVAMCRRKKGARGRRRITGRDHRHPAEERSARDCCCRRLTARTPRRRGRRGGLSDRGGNLARRLTRQAVGPLCARSRPRDSMPDQRRQGAVQDPPLHCRGGPGRTTARGRDPGCHRARAQRQPCRQAGPTRCAACESFVARPPARRPWVAGRG